MRKFQRAAPPEFLATVWEQWGQEWEQRRVANRDTKFNWHQVDGQPVNHLLLPTLKAQTQDHCSFCDNYPVSPPSIETIEHFRPKALFPRLAYCWTNLYFCCTWCQQKNDCFDEAALQPDGAVYEFDRYFRWDYTLGTIEINDLASAEDQKRARVTQDLYRLNQGHPMFRKRELHRRSRFKDLPLDDFAYRDYVEGPLPASPQRMHP